MKVSESDSTNLVLVGLQPGSPQASETPSKSSKLESFGALHECIDYAFKRFPEDIGLSFQVVISEDVIL